MTAAPAGAARNTVLLVHALPAAQLGLSNQQWHTVKMTAPSIQSKQCKSAINHNIKAQRQCVMQQVACQARLAAEGLTQGCNRWWRDDYGHTQHQNHFSCHKVMTQQMAALKNTAKRPERSHCALAVLRAAPIIMLWKQA
jgi:hypothetical protein